MTLCCNIGSVQTLHYQYQMCNQCILGSNVWRPNINWELDIHVHIAKDLMYIDVCIIGNKYVY